ncbi:MAG: PIG-L family deacetylase [Rickettsiales bacterium]|jgi:LmbE family N-acetylglucosaminyl deacetylase|nr:PIG-L family deacetylase [Rickettsiales bacterium]
MILKTLINLIPFSGIRRRLRAKNKAANNPVGYSFGGASPLDFSSSPLCLVVAPHPDDELIGCGGLICKFPKLFDVLCLASAGRNAHDMEAEEMAKIRTRDFHLIMSKAGVRRSVIFEYAGGDLCRGFYEKNIEEYCREAKLGDYGYIFLPHAKDAHEDHRAILGIVKKMAEIQGVRRLNLVFYEVWSPMEKPNSWVDVGDTIHRKCKLISMYSVGKGYAEPAEALARYRGAMLTGFSRRYAEAYRMETIAV